jgi:hypothetical protein
METVHAADSGAAGQGYDWAHEALVTVFENLVEDEFDILGGDSYSYIMPLMGETGMDRAASPLQAESLEESGQDRLLKYPACLPPTLVHDLRTFRQAALEASLHDVVSLRKAVISLKLCVDALE